MRSTLAATIALILFLAPVWAFFEDRMYCRLTTESIFVTLEPDGLYRCDEYITALNTMIKTTAQEIMTIQIYIQEWEDREYRNEIKETLKERIFRLQSMRDDIIITTQNFDQWLFRKVSQALQLEIDKTAEVIAHEYVLLQTYTGTQQEIHDRTERIIEQLDTIEQIRQAETFEILIPLFSRYLYLHRTIQWQLES